MSKKVERALHGPSWTEVILGAVLSLLLGIVLGAVLLIFKPVVTVKELPKEDKREAGAVYFVEGSRDSAKAKQALAKRKALVAGQSVAFTEDELNSFVTPVAPATPAPAPKAGAKKAPEKAPEKAAPAAPASTETIAKGTPNFRIRDGVMQIGMPVTINLLGFGPTTIVQARGGFEKTDNGFAFDPSELYLGSCPVHRLPFISGFVRNKLLGTQALPEDIATAWSKAKEVSLEGNTLKVAM
ncbi:MAG TPA: hypothetical protein VHD62_08015 [Opitutaceae bacterium]|nr:hypothetical protein [Opitutaceae bacterium]